MTSSIKLSLVIPCYNEEKRFSEGINHFHKFLKKQSYKWEIILVNDGSSDKTLNLLKEFSIKNPPLLRQLLGRGFSLLVRLFVDYKIKDTTCGFKAFETKAAKKIFNKITIYDWAFDAEILYLCKKYNIDYAQVPVAWSDVRGSKVSVFRDVIRSLVGLLTIRLNDIQNKY